MIGPLAASAVCWFWLYAHWSTASIDAIGAGVPAVALLTVFVVPARFAGVVALVILGGAIVLMGPPDPQVTARLSADRAQIVTAGAVGLGLVLAVALRPRLMVPAMFATCGFLFLHALNTLDVPPSEVATATRTVINQLPEPNLNQQPTE